jgi:hypothetical protein
VQNHIDSRGGAAKIPCRDELFEAPTRRSAPSAQDNGFSGEDAAIVFPFREPDEIQRRFALWQAVADGT